MRTKMRTTYPNMKMARGTRTTKKFREKADNTYFHEHWKDYNNMLALAKKARKHTLGTLPQLRQLRMVIAA